MGQIFEISDGALSPVGSTLVCQPMPHLTSLDTSSRLLLIVLRRWVADPETVCPAVWAMRRALATGLCGPVISALKGLMDALAERPRAFNMMPPGHVTLSADERALLDLIAAYQHGREDHAAGLLTWLLPPGKTRLAGSERAAELAYRLECGGHRLDAPKIPPAPPRRAAAG